VFTEGKSAGSRQLIFEIDVESMANNSGSKTPIHPLRPAAAAVIVGALILLTWSTGRSGFASLLTAYAARSTQIAPANTAVDLGRGNPDAHYVRAALLESSDLPGAIAEYRQAAFARPQDYVLWLSLARACELNGDTASAVAAARQALPLAPDYAQPHYQLGNILLRAGQSDEAFRELRFAGASNPTLMPGIIDLAWRLSGGNVQFVTQAIEPKTPSAYQMLGQYFREHNQAGAAIAMYSAAGARAADDRRSYLGELIAAKQFKDAANLWAVDRQPAVAPGVMIDPGFEQESNLRDPGFGWRLSGRDTGIHLSLDTTNPREGRSSLKVEFAGGPDPLSPLLSELVLVEPGTHYQLRFAARSEGIVSGGLPVIALMDAEANKRIGQSDPFPTTGPWLEYTIDFDSSQSASAILITLQRQPCSSPSCPIFGRLWLDAFSLRKS
jgi:hypothetical protein